MDVVFHGSSVSDLKLLNTTQHSKKDGYKFNGLQAVCASFYLGVAAAFVHNLIKDSACRRSFENGRFTIREVYKGGFFENYPDLPGSIYILPANNFHYDNDCWGAAGENLEVICHNPVAPIEEIKFSSIHAFLLKLRDSGVIDIRLL